MVSASTLTCTTPAGTQGPATVVVTNVDTQNATLAAGYIFQGPAPTLTGVSPAAGPLAGGTTVTLTGTNFVNGATVTFGGALATAVNVVSATQITCTNPAGTIGSAGVTVTNVDTLSATLANGYTYQGSTPTVTAVTPSSGPLGGGTFVTVTGTNFATGATVDFGGSLATGVAVVSGTQITCTTPSGTGPVTVTVTNVDTLFGSLAAGFTFAGTPATVSNVNPATGGIAGGTLTTITGSNFAAGATVRFGAGTAGSVNVVSGTTITCTTPAGPIGPANVEVNNPFSSPGTLVNGFTYQGATPTLTNVNPGAGPLAGGTSVTLTGTNFAAGATVQFGGVQATGVTVVSGTQITCTTPSGTFGPVSVAVTNVDLQSATLPSGYIYQGAAPTLTNVTPGAGPLAGGTALTLTGTNFVTGATVTVGGSSATSVTVVSASTITCTAPSGTQGPATVVVTNIDTQSATLAGGYIYQGPAPTLSSVSPAAGPLAGGTTVTLTGTNFVAGATVTFGGNPATGVNVVSGTQITCATPAGTIGSTNVTVTNVDTLFATLSNGYLYQGGNPTVTSVSPSSGPLGGGTFVTVTGTNFFAGATVDFGGSLATSVAVVSGTQITCSTPSGTGLVTVTVTNVDTLFGSLPGGFNYAGTPATVSSITPSSGPVAGGTAVSITGTNFVSGASVTIGGFSASSISIVSATLITCTTPAGTAGPANVEVTNPSSAPGTLVGGYTYLGPPPTLGSVNPSSGPTAGGTNVTLTGTNFVSGASVTFGGNAASSINVASSTTITCVTPAGSAGPVAVVVTNPDTQQATQPTGFSYSSGGPPTVSSVSPSSGAAAGGSPVTITGTNFLAGATVDFGGVQATNVVVGSGNLITATVPAHQPAVVTVRVTNTDGQFGSQSGAFTFQGPPALNAVTPSSGSAAGGTRVVLYGTGFAAGATVTFAGVQAFETVVSLDGTELAVVTPPGTAGTVSVVVTNPAGTPTTGGQVSTLLSAYTYVTAGTDPTIGLLNPAVGPTSGGNFITITGNNFQTSGTTNVHFGTGAGSSVNVLDTQTVVVRVPGRSAGAVAVSIVNPNGLSVTKLEAYTYEAGSTPPAFGGVGIARALGGRAIELSWSAASDNGTPGSKMRYRVYVATSSGGQNFTAPDFTTDPGVTRFTVGGRSPGGTYYFVVRAVDELGNEDSNTVERFATTTSAPAASPWPADKSMGTARRRHTATLLADGRVLVVGGDNGGSLSSVEIYDPALGVWSNTGSLNTARERHTAVLLGNGQVLVAGGLQSGVPTTVLSSCELWNPTTGTWTATSGMSGARMDHTSTLLRDGRVLVAGGDNLGARSSSELYNVGSGGWSSTTNSMAGARARHTATLLASGLVLVTGGDNSGPLKGAELFDPTFNTWSTGGTMNGSRRRHTATRLRDGRVLVVGGDGGGPVATAELYDPGKASWSNAGSMATGRMAHTATLVPDGRVVVACGQGAAGGINGTEAYDPVAGTWSSTSTMGLGGRFDHTATLMATGRILAVGGDSAGASALSFRFDPALGAGTWYSVGSLTTARTNHNAVLLPDGRVLVVAGESGGATPSPLTNAELYDPQRQSWVGGGDDATKRTRRGAVLLTDGRVLLAAGDRGSGLSDDCALYRPDAASFTVTTDSGPDRVEPMTVLLRSGRVLMMGGDGGLNALDHVERYDATSGNWVNRTKMNDARRRFAVAVLENGKVLAAGGESLSTLNRAELYDPSVDSWTATSSTMTTSRRHHTATLLPGGRVLIAAGHNTGFLNSAELYDPTSSTFTSTGSLASGRRDHTATLLADGRVLAVGGRNALSGLTSAELYDPAAAAWSGTGSLANRREGHAATLLPDGRVLVTGGQGTTTLASCELYDPGKAFADEWRPHIIAVHGNSTFPATLPYSTNVTIDGDRLRGMGETGGGASNASAGDAPVAMLVGPIGGEGGRSHSGAGRTFLLPATAFADGKTLLFRTPSSATIGKGYYMLRIVTNGVPSVARIIHLP
ncbi:MAG: IPT/TIG domain-containing protein [Planctomycetota bacterium]